MDIIYNSCSYLRILSVKGYDYIQKYMAGEKTVPVTRQIKLPTKTKEQFTKLPDWSEYTGQVNKEGNPHGIGLISNKYADKNGVETRPIVAGNLAKQPAILHYPEISFNVLEGADLIHEQGLYIGIHPTTKLNNLSRVIDLIDNFCEQWQPNE